MTLDPVATVEACYRPAADDSSWLAGILETLDGLQLGGGFVARVKDAGPGGGFRTLAAAARGVDVEDWADRIESVHAMAPPGSLAAIYWPCPPVRRARAVARQIGPEAEQLLATALGAIGFDDSWGVLAGGPEGRLLDIGIGVRGRAHLAPRTRHQLALISAHLTSALRLRACLAASVPGPESERTEAVLDPGGTVRHAVGPAETLEARQSLTLAVQHMERARGRLRRTSPEEAMEIWRGLVDGRWSLVDHHESSGRRLVLVRRNDPLLPDPRVLTARERDVLAYAALGHSSKYVAYLLGLAPGTVASHLSRACQKLQVKNRREAVALLWPGLVPPPPSTPGAPPPRSG